MREFHNLYSMRRGRRVFVRLRRMLAYTDAQHLSIEIHVNESEKNLETIL